MINKKFTMGIAVALFLGFLSGNSFAADSYRFNGFLSAAGGKTLDDDDTRRVDWPSNGVYDEDIDFRPDTILGVQLQFNVNDRLRATGQLVSRGGDGYGTGAEWAYASYKVDESLTLHAGRKRAPFYLYSDYLDVGYTYHWIRPPMEVYGDPFTSYDGFSANYQRAVASWDMASGFYAGSETYKDTTDSIDLSFDVKNILGGFVTFSNDIFTLRANYFTGMVSLSFDEHLLEGGDSPFEGITFYLPAGTPIKEDSRVNFWGGAIKADNGSLFAIAEYTKTDLNPMGDFDNYYVSIGARITDFTPHLTYSNRLAEDVATDAEKSETSAVTVGLRWDFAPDIAFKLEYQQVTEDEPVGYAGNLDADGLADDVDLISFGVDLIF